MKPEPKSNVEKYKTDRKVIGDKNHRKIHLFFSFFIILNIAPNGVDQYLLRGKNTQVSRSSTQTTIVHICVSKSYCLTPLQLPDRPALEFIQVPVTLSPSIFPVKVAPLVALPTVAVKTPSELTVPSKL